MSLQLWDTASEEVEKVEAPSCEPNILEYMNGKIIVADKWVQVYDLKLSWII